MAVTNPTKLVTVQRLNRFRQKLKEELPSSSVATVAESEAAANELT
jgi:hypothetical protein